jgi:hypothetical protein
MMASWLEDRGCCHGIRVSVVKLRVVLLRRRLRVRKAVGR